MTPQERLDYLLESVFVPTNRLVTISDLESTLDDFGFALVRLTLDTASQPQIVDGMSQVEILIARATAKKIEDAVEAMRSTDGLSLSTPARQAVIDQLAIAGEWPDTVRDTVKALGGVWQPRWQWEGYASEPTLTQVTNQMLVDFARSKITAINAWLDTYDVAGKTVQQVEQYIADLFASEDGNP